LPQLLTSALDLARVADDLDVALRLALDLVGEFAGLPLGHAALVDDANGTLTSTGVWHCHEPERFAGFIERSEAMSMPAGVGLPGRVLESRQSAWIADIRDDTNFPRRDAALACGIKTAIAAPVISARGIVGVIEFFALEALARDEQVAAVIDHIATVLGATADRLHESAERAHAEDKLRRSERNLAEAQRLAHIGSWTWDVGSDFVIWSAELHRIYGVEGGAGPVSFDDYIGRVHPDDRERVASAVRGTVATLQPFEHDYRVVWPDGEVRWVHAAGEVTAQADGRAVRLGGFCHDVTQQRHADERRRLAQEALLSHRQILERIARGERLGATLDALCRDVEARCPGARCSILTVGTQAAVLRHAAAPSLPSAFRDAIDGLPINEQAGACGRAASRREDVVVVDTFADTLTADFVTLAQGNGLRAVWSHPLISAGGDLLGTFAVYRGEPHTPDPDEREAVAAAGSIAAVAIERAASEAALTAAARRDPLTGLPNRSTFLDELTYRLSLPGRRTAVLFCDLDRFKWINDSLGHTAGDRVLVDVAWRLERALDGRHLLARFGGDEFTVLVEDAEPAELEDVAGRLVSALDAPFLLEGGEFFLSVSIGIATKDDDSADAVDLVRDADAAMYAAKDRGRGRHAHFDRALRERAVARVTTETDLRRGLDRDEFVMHYQPIVDLRTGTWAGVESLVRWQHPTRGLVGPDDFIPLAEETGLINPLGQRILGHVLTDTANEVGEGLGHVAVNISPVQLADPFIVRDLAAALDDHGFDPARLVVELTETAVMQQLDTALVAVQGMVDLGAIVMIDDFGTGYSSIARLQELPVTGVKIDRSFSTRLGTTDTADRLVAAIADLAHAIDLTVVVEGIETTAAATRAAELGCDYAQGYHYARPAPLPMLRQS
jgi:diguanylate cyclase (GGDEF)-like protein